MIATGKTHMGLARKKNEDSFAVYGDSVGSLPNLYIVADGMGGHKGGEVASSTAVKSFVEYLDTCDSTNDIMDILAEGIQYANRAVFAMAQNSAEYSNMGTTFTACVIDRGKGFAAHVGDSRLYLISDGEMRLVTSDHSYVNEMVKAGKMSKEEALCHPCRNILTRALGIDSRVPADGYVFEFKDEDVLLICSDGLTNMVAEEEILLIIDSCGDIEEAADMLIEAANNNGGIDNITVVLAGTKRVNR